MHEIALVQTIFSTLEDEFPGRMDSIRGIYLSVGLLSNVQPILMKNAFAAVLENEPRYRKSTLQVELLPVIIYCSVCDKTTQLPDYKFVCGSCGKPSNDIRQGEELKISKVEFVEMSDV